VSSDCQYILRLVEGVADVVVAAVAVEDANTTSNTKKGGKLNFLNNLIVSLVPESHRIRQYIWKLIIIIIIIALNRFVNFEQRADF